MPLSIAQYLRHLAVRCTRMSRDCIDFTVARELESVSVELVEKAENLEILFTLTDHSADTEGPDDSTKADSEK